MRWIEMLSFQALQQVLLTGMDNFQKLTDVERGLVEKNKIAFVNVHKVPLDATLEQWNQGAWFILNPRFFSGIIHFDRKQLQAIIASILEINAVELTDASLENDLINKQKNQVVFNAFVMLKIIKEHIPSSPRLLSDTPDRQFLTDYMQSLGDKNIPFFDSLFNVIAQIAIKSTLQQIALNYAIEQKGLDTKQINNPANKGICELSSQDFQLMTELFDREELLKLQRLFDKYRNQYEFARIFTGLIEAILENKPTNFLAFLNVKNTSAQQELEQIEKALQAAQLRQQELANNKRLVAQIKGELDVLLREINETNNPRYIQAMYPLTLPLNTALDAFEAGELDKGAFLDLVADTIKPVVRFFIKENQVEWYTPQVNLLKMVANYAISFKYNQNDNPNQFFTIPGTALNRIYRFAADCGIKQVDSNAPQGI